MFLRKIGRKGVNPNLPYFFIWLFFYFTSSKSAPLLAVEPVEVDGSEPSKGEPEKLKVLFVVLPD